METSYMTFSKKDQEKGLHLKFLDYLLEFNRESNDHFVEILIKPEECNFLTIEWIENYYETEAEYSTHYKPVSTDQYVMMDYEFPDGHYEYVESYEQGNELLKEWLKENPGWEKTEYGRWVNKEENEKLLKEFKDEGIL